MAGTYAKPKYVLYKDWEIKICNDLGGNLRGNLENRGGNSPKIVKRTGGI